MPTKRWAIRREEGLSTFPNSIRILGKMATEEEQKQTPADVGGIDKMFE